MFSIEAAITYFVNKKFGIVATIMPALAKLQKSQNIEAETPSEVIEIENYKKSLREIEPAELENRYNQAIAMDITQAKQNAINEENLRFYNLQSANADFVHWSKAAHWSLDEAIALSFGKEPEIVTWKKIEPLKDKTAFAKAYAKRRDLALRATRWKKFGDTIPPVIFISWTKEVHIELPNALIEEVTKVGGVAINWHGQYLKVKAERDELASKPENKQKSESTRKTENVLQAFAGIAIDAYGYEPKSAKSTAPQDIAVALSKLGKKVDQKTIRNWLKEGIELLPANPHKD